MVHDIESRHPQILAKTKSFLHRRAATKLDSQGRPTKTEIAPGEIAFDDEWVSRGNSIYTGKIYSNATEILTMGAERLFTEPIRFSREDPDFFDFIISIFQK